MTGLDPATSPVTGECSNQLSYISVRNFERLESNQRLPLFKGTLSNELRSPTIAGCTLTTVRSSLESAPPRTVRTPLVVVAGIKPATFPLSRGCSIAELHDQNSVGVQGFEPWTSRLSSVRSTRLSYTPKDETRDCPSPTERPRPSSDLAGGLRSRVFLSFRRRERWQDQPFRGQSPRLCIGSIT